MTGLAKIAILALGVLVVAAGIAGALYWGGALSAKSTLDEEPLAPAAAPRASIPPIDAAAPTQIETATFALG